MSVTTCDSACIHMAELGDRFGLIVFDECHHLPGRIRQDAARMSTAQKRLGLTATPERSDGRHSDLLELVGPTAYELSINAVRGKSLAEYEVVRIPVHLSESEQRRYDLLSEEVQSYVYAQRQENAGFTWEDLCSSSAASLEAEFAEKWGPDERDGWKLLREAEILHRGQKTFVPDFVLQHVSGRRVLMEIVGFWTPEYLTARLETLRIFRDVPRSCWRSRKVR